MEMRVGKTDSALETMIGNDEYPILIICPKPLLYNWERDAKRYLPWLKIVTVEGSKKTKEEILDSNTCQVYIVNWNIVAGYDVLNRKNWKQIYLDESATMGSKKSTFCNYLLSCPKPPGQKRYALSGLPAPEGVKNLWPQMFFVDGHFLGYDSYILYMMNHWRMDLDRQDLVMIDPINHSRDILNYVHRNAFCASRKALGIGPQKKYEKLFVKPSPKQLQLADLVKTTTRYKNRKNQSIEMIPIVRGNMYNQICSGIDPFYGEMFDNPKAKLIYDWYDEYRTPFIVLGFFVEQLRDTRNYLESRGINCAYIDGDTRDMSHQEDMFISGQADAIIAQVRTVKMGKDYSRADDIFYISNSTWFDDRGQSEDRVVIATKKGTVRSWDIVVDQGADERLADILTGTKRVNSDAVLNKMGSENYW